eukprot:3625648-Rhodomonas_salina.2
MCWRDAQSLTAASSPRRTFCRSSWVSSAVACESKVFPSKLIHTRRLHCGSALAIARIPAAATLLCERSSHSSVDWTPAASSTSATHAAPSSPKPLLLRSRSRKDAHCRSTGASIRVLHAPMALWPRSKNVSLGTQPRKLTHAPLAIARQIALQCRGWSRHTSAVVDLSTFWRVSRLRKSRSHPLS